MSSSASGDTRAHYRTCNLCEAMCGIEIELAGDAIKWLAVLLGTVILTLAGCSPTFYRKQADREFIQQQEDILRTRLGDDYRNKLNIYERALEHPESPIPQAIREKLQGARYEDGTQIVNDAEFATWVIEMGLDTWGEGAMRTGEAATI